MALQQTPEATPAEAVPARFAITCAICCHNSADRLSRVLKQLAAQQTDFDWELLVIDNASSDETARIAHEFWTREIPLRVIREPQPGQTNARLRALHEAKGGIVSFLDDDNWPASDFLQRVHNTMSGDPRLGALGGLNTPVSKIALPDWFMHNASTYAVGPQRELAGEVEHVFGAGISVRVNAFREMEKKGFQFSLGGRAGTALEASEDYELCLALQLAGWRIFYDPAIRLEHHLPVRRLQRSYLHNAVRALSRSGVLLDPYFFALGKCNGRTLGKFEKRWIWKVLVSAVRLAISAISFNRIQLEIAIGRLQGLLSARSFYNAQIAAIRIAPWRKK